MAELPDDSDDKVRRNLVSASAAIILSAWLGIPLATLLNFVNVRVAVSDLLAAAFAVLGYLAYRYNFGPEGQRAGWELRRVEDSIVQKDSTEILIAAVAKFPAPTIVSEALWDLICREAASRFVEGKQVIADGATVSRVVPHGWTSPWTGQFYLNVHFLSPVPDRLLEPVSTEVNLTLQGRWLRSWLTGRARVLAWSNSVAGATYAAPALLGWAAMGILIWRLAAAYGNSWPGLNTVVRYAL